MQEVNTRMDVKKNMVRGCGLDSTGLG